VVAKASTDAFPAPHSQSALHCGLSRGEQVRKHSRMNCPVRVPLHWLVIRITPSVFSAGRCGESLVVADALCLSIQLRMSTLSLYDRRTEASS
jgi:hypothetical protein